MPQTFRLSLVVAGALLTVPFMSTRASLVLSAVQDQLGYEPGSQLILLTLQSNPAAMVEQGCNPFGTTGFGAYAATDNNFAGTTANAGNYCDETRSDNTTSPPQNHVPVGTVKTALPTLSTASISSTNEIGVLFNINQQFGAGVAITLSSLVLSFYTATGDVIFSATLPSNFCSFYVGVFCSGSRTFAFSEPGVLSESFLFVLDPAQQALLSAAMSSNSLNFTNTYVGVSAVAGCTGSEIQDNCMEATGGPESFALVRATTTAVVPEPATLALLGTGLIGLGGFVRRRSRQS